MHPRDRDTTILAPVLRHPMHQFWPFLDDPKRHAQGFVDSALLLLCKRVRRVGVPGLASKAQRVAYLEL